LQSAKFHEGFRVHAQVAVARLEEESEAV
jgi:hypothetical protein